MVGQGVLRECLRAADVDQVISVVRAPGGTRDPKLVEVVHADFSDFSAIADRFAGVDACLFCLGVSSAGMTEADYTRITYDTTMAAARLVPRTAVFIYVSGAGTGGRSMWARVKGKTEDD